MKLLVVVCTFFFSINCHAQEYQEINNNPDFKGFSLIESYPQYPGGIDGLLEDISERAIIPEKAIKKGLHGSVTVSFIVQVDGSISEIEIIESDNKIFNQPTIDVLTHLEKWKRSIQRGEPVKVKFEQKIKY